jgi:spermidine synthase
MIMLYRGLIRLLHLDARLLHRTPRLLELTSPFDPESAVVRVLELPGASKDDIRQGIADGSYSKPFIVDEGATRSLHFEMASIQSEMRVDDPDALQLAYTRKMMAFLLFNPAPSRVALLGLGGGSLAKFCYRHLPAADISVIEIDADVIALRDEFRVPRDDDRFRVVRADGAAFVAQTDAQLDVLLVDAYDRDGISPALACESFYSQAAASLTNDGVFVMNVCGNRRHYASVIGYMRTAFGGRVVELPALADGNLIVFGFNSATTAGRPFADSAEAICLQQRLGLDLPRYRKLMKHASCLVPGLTGRTGRATRLVPLSITSVDNSDRQ